MNIIDIIVEILADTAYMFVEMAPYILIGLVFVGLLYMFITKDMVSKHMGNNNFWSVLKAALFGVPLPLCSCGVIPTAVYMYRNGASRSSVVSFLISTPQTGIDSIIATYGMLGWVFAVFRPLAAFVMGIIGGLTVRVFESGSDREKDKEVMRIAAEEYTLPEKGFKNRIKKAARYSFVEFLDDISVQFIFGIALAGLITYLIPDDFFMESGINSGIAGMLIMIAVGIPMYVCATASIPIAIALMMKGFSPGTAFAFLAAGPATNAASLSILVKALGKKTTSIFVATIAVLSLIFGLLLDAIFAAAAISPHTMMMHGHDHNSGLINEDVKLFLSILFLILLLMSVYRKYIRNRIKKKEVTMQSQDILKINIEGMNCNHCVMNVRKAIEKVEGVKSVEVILQDGTAIIEGAPDIGKVRQSVEDVGYKVTG